jgi:hypothetical protein
VLSSCCVVVCRQADKSKRAAIVLNSSRVLAAACSESADKVLASVPLVDYQDWMAKTANASDLVQVRSRLLLIL